MKIHENTSMTKYLHDISTFQYVPFILLVVSCCIPWNSTRCVIIYPHNIFVFSVSGVGILVMDFHKKGGFLQPFSVCCDWLCILLHPCQLLLWVFFVCFWCQFSIPVRSHGWYELCRGSVYSPQEVPATGGFGLVKQGNWKRWCALCCPFVAGQSYQRLSIPTPRLSREIFVASPMPRVFSKEQGRFEALSKEFRFKESSEKAFWPLKPKHVFLSFAVFWHHVLHSRLTRETKSATSYNQCFQVVPAKTIRMGNIAPSQMTLWVGRLVSFVLAACVGQYVSDARCPTCYQPVL